MLGLLLAYHWSATYISWNIAVIVNYSSGIHHFDLIFNNNSRTGRLIHVHFWRTSSQIKSTKGWTRLYPRKRSLSLFSFISLIHGVGVSRFGKKKLMTMSPSGAKKNFFKSDLSLAQRQNIKKSYFSVIDAFLGYTGLNKVLSCVSESWILRMR